MNYLKLFVAISLFLPFKTSLFAQYNNLLKDKNISWIAEIENNYSFEVVQNARTEHFNWVYPLKILENNPKNFSNKVSIDTLLFWQSLLDTPCIVKTKDAVSDSLIHSCRCYMKYQTVDTIQVVEIADNSKHLSVIYNIYSKPHYYSHFKVKQILYFDYKKQCFNTKIIAIMPVFIIIDMETGMSILKLVG